MIEHDFTLKCYILLIIIVTIIIANAAINYKHVFADPAATPAKKKHKKDDASAAVMEYLKEKQIAKTQFKQEEIEIKKQELQLARDKFQLEERKLNIEAQERQQRMQIEYQEREMMMRIIKEKLL